MSTFRVFFWILGIVTGCRGWEGVGISRIPSSSLGWSGAATQLLALVYFLTEVLCTVSGGCKRAWIGDPEKSWSITLSTWVHFILPAAPLADGKIQCDLERGWQEKEGRNLNLVPCFKAPFLFQLVLHPVFTPSESVTVEFVIPAPLETPWRWCNTCFSVSCLSLCNPHLI